MLTVDQTHLHLNITVIDGGEHQLGNISCDGDSVEELTANFKNRLRTVLEKFRREANTAPLFSSANIDCTPHRYQCTSSSGQCCGACANHEHAESNTRK